jgi:hypothetical protein
VVEMSAEEYRDFLDEEARQRLGMSAEEFRRRSSPASWMTAIPTSGCSAALIAIGQNDLA